MRKECESKRVISRISDNALRNIITHGSQRNPKMKAYGGARSPRRVVRFLEAPRHSRDGVAPEAAPPRFDHEFAHSTELRRPRPRPSRSLPTQKRAIVNSV